MKKLQVIVQDKNTLVLLEDGQKGDLIYLNELSNVDLSKIEDLISYGKDQVYEKKLTEVRNAFTQELDSKLRIQKLDLLKNYEQEVNKLKEKINEQSLIEELKINEVKRVYNEKLNEKEEKIKLLEATFNDKIQNEKLSVEKVYLDKIAALTNKVNELNAKIELDKLKTQGEHEKAISDLMLKHAEELREKEAIIADKDMKYNELQNRKAATNNKMIGEGLEEWCNTEMESYMQNGFLNCRWFKDNRSIKTEDETKGTKADYIFQIYATNERKDEDLLASVCLEMKDENPNSKNKQKNSAHYDKLDKDREKKGCKYAILVSNLEMDNPNDIPIYKVREYNDMYMVRPGYMLVLLNMITSLTTNFKDLLLQANKEKLEVKSKLEFIAEFEELKHSYLEKGLMSLEKNVSSIKEKSAKIISAAEDVDNLCNTIIASYINSIMAKLETFQTKITREYNKFEKKS